MTAGGDSARLKSFIREIPDFPKPGILFKDITPLLADPAAFASALSVMTAPFAKAGITAVAAVESRGFLFGAAIARLLDVSLIPVRKKGKLPYRTVDETYALEYGSDTLSVHADSLGSSDRVLVVDDVLATGGTAAATVRLVERLGARVSGISFLIELSFLKGRDKLAGLLVQSALVY